MTTPFASIINLSPAAAQRGKARREADLESRLFGDVSTFWRDFIDAAFNPYRPEDHYMRGRGPAWHAKHGDR